MMKTVEFFKILRQIVNSSVYLINKLSFQQVSSLSEAPVE